MTFRLAIMPLFVASALFGQGEAASGNDDFRREVAQRLDRQRAAYAADLAANRQWMQQMTKEFENQNEVIRKLRDEVVALRKELAREKVNQSSAGGEISQVKNDLIRRIEDEAIARQAADKRLVKSVSAEIARAAAAAAPKQAPRPAPKGRTIRYTVAPGDTLSAIATAFGTTVGTIKSINGLSSDSIGVGQKLTVPAP